MSLLSDGEGEGADFLEVTADDIPCDDTAFSRVCARDLLNLLLSRITGPARATLLDLADGLSCKEIALARSLSHQAVSKHRQQILALVARLDAAARCKH